ncbi:MAG: type III secretion system inner rod subunit SctI [Ramlibacter sp.]
MDIAFSSVSLPLTPALGVDDAVPARAPANEANVERFNAAMESPGGAAATPAVTAAGEAAQPYSARHGIGDNILNGIKSLSGELEQKWGSLHKDIGISGNMTSADMLRMQMQLCSMTMQFDLVSKGVSKTTQNIEQLVKMQ